ncbi:MAG: hypothetical protein KBC30_07710 [Planctomycetes bacterium]|nr:hypothetical protein [Planctomycetota bacterium]HPY75581.1 hypothetical protein [Planctomycetota bacterium]HQB01210.1 hypothetical protein [Planctomycetota bacterium]
MLWGVNLLWGFALLLWGISFLWGEELLWEGARGSCPRQKCCSIKFNAN